MLRITPNKHKPFKKIYGYADDCYKLELEDDLANALSHLIQAGELGCTPADLNISSVSQRISQLRNAGVKVKTVRANNPATGKGLHLRYVLGSTIVITGFELNKEGRYVASPSVLF
jgi:hypothetical protein